MEGQFSQEKLPNTSIYRCNTFYKHLALLITNEKYKPLLKQNLLPTHMSPAKQKSLTLARKEKAITTDQYKCIWMRAR